MVDRTVESGYIIPMKVELLQQKQGVVLTIAGHFIRWNADEEINRLSNDIRRLNPRKVICRDNGIEQWDSSLVVLLYNLMQGFPNISFETKSLPEGIRRLLELAFAVDRKPTLPQTEKENWLEQLGGQVLSIEESVRHGLTFIRKIGVSVLSWIKGQSIMRSDDFWFALQDCGPGAVAIVSLISFMVGLILAFVGAIQLKSFGAQIYVASLVAIGMTRIMGAIMIGIIMAGRTGASYAAAIGTMQVNEELDALKTMGISRIDFLVLPRILALVSAMPFLVVLADVMGILGGASVGVFMLGIAPAEYLRYTIEACNMTNFWVGLFHGVVFGVVIAVCGCYFGMMCGRNADSVGVATTRAVVYAVVWMIVMTGLMTLICEVMGI